MKPFEPPANANLPAAEPGLWSGWGAAPETFYFAPLRFWIAAHQASVQLMGAFALSALSTWGGTQPGEENAPLQCAAEDVREAGAAMVRAQMDTVRAMGGLERSA